MVDGIKNYENNMETMMYRGSRKHVLDWTGKPSFLHDLAELLEPVSIQVRADTRFMPQGYDSTDEARLETFGPKCIESDAWEKLQVWWLKHTKGANTPNWDIAVYCTIEDRPGFILVEAKANSKELKKDGKPLYEPASQNSRENHEQIARAIEEACIGWQRFRHPVSITGDSHYQLANRLAFTWKLAMLGFPVVLVYLGFTGDEGIRGVGIPFSDGHDWKRAFASHLKGIFPIELFERRLDLGLTPVWLLSRSRPVTAMSPQLPSITKPLPKGRS